MLQYVITKEGFGKNSGQLPPALKEPLMIFDHINSNDARKKTEINSLYTSDNVVPRSVRKEMNKLLSKRDYLYLTQQMQYSKKRLTNNTYRCPVGGFVPYDDQGKVILSAINDGVPLPYEKIVLNTSGKVTRAPHILVLYMIDNFIAALAFLFFTSNESVKLEYLCAAPRYKGAGTTLLKSLPQQLSHLKHINYIYLNDDSGKKGRTNSKGVYHHGFYSRPNIGYERHGKTPTGQYYKKAYNSFGKSIRNTSGKSVHVNKILDVYRKQIKPLKRDRSLRNTDTRSTRRKLNVRTVSSRNI